MNMEKSAMKRKNLTFQRDYIIMIYEQYFFDK